MILKLALITGQHVGEIAVMTKAELDLSYASPTWTQAAARRKNKGVSRIPLSPLTVKLIIEALARSGDSAYLFHLQWGTRQLRHTPTHELSAGQDLYVSMMRVHEPQQKIVMLTGMATVA
jgi:integrase